MLWEHEENQDTTFWKLRRQRGLNTSFGVSLLARSKYGTSDPQTPKPVLVLMPWAFEAASQNSTLRRIRTRRPWCRSSGRCVLVCVCPRRSNVPNWVAYCGSRQHDPAQYLQFSSRHVSPWQYDVFWSFLAGVGLLKSKNSTAAGSKPKRSSPFIDSWPTKLHNWTAVSPQCQPCKYCSFSIYIYNIYIYIYIHNIYV